MRSHPDVMDAIVVGAPDERWGQTVAAIVQPRPGRAPALEDIQAHCRTSIAGYKLPRRLHTVPRSSRSPEREARLPVGQRHRRRRRQPTGDLRGLTMPVDLRRLPRPGQALPGGPAQEAPGRLPGGGAHPGAPAGRDGRPRLLPRAGRGVPSEAGMVAHTARLLGAARAAGLAVVHCTAEFRADRAGPWSTRRSTRPSCGAPGTSWPAPRPPSWSPGLGADPGDLVSRRAHGVSPFTGTSLDATLRNLGVRVLVVAGVSVNLGVLGALRGGGQPRLPGGGLRPTPWPGCRPPTPPTSCATPWRWWLPSPTWTTWWPPSGERARTAGTGGRGGAARAGGRGGAARGRRRPARLRHRPGPVGDRRHRARQRHHGARRHGGGHRPAADRPHLPHRPRPAPVGGHRLHADPGGVPARRRVARRPPGAPASSRWAWSGSWWPRWPAGWRPPPAR